MKIFQLVSLIVFAAFIIIAVIILSAYRSGSGQAEANSLTVWGTISASNFNSFLDSSGLSERELFSITYVEKRKESFYNDFVEALASGIGPDIVLLEDNSVLRYKSRLFTIPFSEYSERDFKNNFVEAGEVFLEENSILAVPMLIDPLVMYWNRDIFTSVSKVSPIRYWDELHQFSRLVTKKDSSLRITRSAVALGESLNITNSKEILTSLFIQSGNPVFRRSGGNIVSTLSESFSQPIPPAQSALSFYTDFAHPTKDFNSWNRSLPNSLDLFVSGDLGIYFGFASEIFSIRDKNPYLNFDTAPLPIMRESALNLTYGRVHGMAIVRSSRKITSSLNFIKLITGKDYALNLAMIATLPPARRDLLSIRPSEAFMATFYDAAIKTRAWLDPDKTQTDAIFRNMIESVTSGRSSSAGAVERATSEINLLYR